MQINRHAQEYLQKKNDRHLMRVQHEFQLLEPLPNLKRMYRSPVLAVVKERDQRAREEDRLGREEKFNLAKKKL